jgi:hypothetical protein
VSTHPQVDPQTAILMLGMHRSGTSAATRIVNLLGANLGSDLLSPQADNQQGFWEHTKAVEIHEELLSALGRTWHDVREMPVGWLDHPASQHAVDRVVELIRTDLGTGPLWAVKDPRMCRLLPIWLWALREFGVRPAALIVVRDPREVARSLHVRDGWSYAHSYHMWSQHFLEAVRMTEGLDRAIVSYDDLMSDWVAAMTRVGANLRVQWPRSIDEARTDIEQFINPGDRHHHAAKSDQEMVAGTVPPPTLMELYDLSRAVASGKASWSEVLPINARYLEATSIYGQQVGELVEKHNDVLRVALERMDHINGLRAAHDELVKERDDYKSVTLNRLSQIRRMEHTIHELEGRYEEATRLYAQLLGSFETMAHRQGELEIEAVSLHSSVSTLHSESEALEDKVQGYEGRISQARDKMRSRKWLVRRIWRLTLGKASLADDEI